MNVLKLQFMFCAYCKIIPRVTRKAVRVEVAGHVPAVEMTQEVGVEGR